MANVLRPTPDDALAAWTVLLRASQEQASRLAEAVEGEGEAFWEGRLPRFRPGGSDSEELPYLLALARPDEVWMDIGAGAGRLAIPLSAAVRGVVAIEPSPTMRGALTEGAAAAGRDNVLVRDLRWPAGAGAAPEVDVTLAANMLYGEPRPVAFLEAMERHARRFCVVALADRAPRSPDGAVFEALHGEREAALPGAREFVALLSALGRRPDVQAFDTAPGDAVPLEQAVAQQRARYGLAEGSARLGRLGELFAQHFERDGDRVRVRAGRSYTAVVTWRPPAR